MLPKASQIFEIPDGAAAAVDDEITVIYATPFPARTGATKSDAISVEDYRPRHKRNTIGLSPISNFDDDDVTILPISPELRRRVILKGESSLSISKDDTKSVPCSTFMCEICADEKPKEENFRVLGCRHSYCTDCMRKYVASKLENNIISIKCPVAQCKGSLELQHCRSILPDQVFIRWGDALCEALILATEKFYCPFKDCSALLIDERKCDNEGIAESECPNCNRLFCAMCKVPWHSGLSCGQFQGLKEDERSSEDLMAMNLAKNMKWMRCPHCSIYVEKIHGCFFISCRCGYNFCYNCGAANVQHYGHTC